jgi:hypothetical protein
MLGTVLGSVLVALLPSLGAGAAQTGHTDGVAFHAATLIADGRVLVTGGRNGRGTFRHAEVFDPATGTTSALEARAIAPRSEHTATALPDGTVLVAGGRGLDPEVHASAEVVDPRTGTWRAVGAMAVPRFSHTATLLPDGRVLVAGGESSLGGDRELRSAELYDPATGRFEATGGIEPGAPAEGMAQPRSAHTATPLDDGRVLITGGVAISGGLFEDSGRRSAELFDPRSGRFSSADTMGQGRFGHTATRLPDGRVLIVGGASSVGSVLDSAEIYDPVSGRFEPTGDLHEARMGHTATLMPDGGVLVIGGQDGATTASKRLPTVERFEPRSGTFTEQLPIALARAFHTATPVQGGVLLIGGETAQLLRVRYVSAIERYEPAPRNLGPTPSFAGLWSRGRQGQLGWATPAAATRFETCRGATSLAAAKSCSRASRPVLTIDWQEVVRESGRAGEVRVFRQGWRQTGLRGCHADGCSRLGLGPSAGGLRWPNWDIAFDYYAMAFDVATARGTAAGAVNLADARRDVLIVGGPSGGPASVIIANCPRLRPGSVCQGAVTGPALAFVTVRTSAPGAPTTEHRIPVR